MNERIKELHNQAFKETQDYYATMQKFAELIVWECINSLEFHGFDDAIPYVKWMATNKLGQHFGVEEPKGWICSKCGTDRTKAVCPQGPSASVDGRCPMIASAQ